MEEKLTHAPKSLIIDPPQRGTYQAPDRPGRPTNLISYKNQHKSHFPSADQLENEEHRATLLHFFANHELLAVELMALALLKFPDAPDSFRRGVFHTLKEEQNHTKWYVQRMKECGIEFGDMPVSPMIWEHIADMESPLDYVSRLSLTFEQANLDYAHYYSKILHDIGDAKSAKILQTVYKDEIAHVGHGIKWLRRWKKRSQTDWDAWHKQLHLPLSPIRAKGITPFNEEGRRKAGLDDHFIASLKRFQFSRGRSPDMWFFNPYAEVEQGTPGWTCPKKLDDLAADLEPAFALAMPSQDDLVLLRRMPTNEHRDRLEKHELTFPETVLFSEKVVIEKSRKLRSTRPWAQLTPLLSKEATLRLRNLLPAKLNPIPAKICTDDIAKFIAEHPDEDWVGKDLFSAAGRGIFRFSKDDLSRLPKRTLLIEPWLEKTHEFSLLFHRSTEAEGGLKFIGTVHQETSANGQWLSSESRSKPARGLNKSLAIQLNQQVFPAVKNEIHQALEKLCAEENYYGPLCLDSFFYGEDRWQPIVELNARWTMGRIAHQLRHKLARSQTLKLSTCSLKDADSLSQKGAILLGDPKTSSTRMPIIEIT